jgi:hypothetical protein
LLTTLSKSSTCKRDGHTYLIGNILYVIWRDSKMKSDNIPITAVYKALNYNMRDDLTNEKQK